MSHFHLFFFSSGLHISGKVLLTAPAPLAPLPCSMVTKKTVRTQRNENGYQYWVQEYVLLTHGKYQRKNCA